jgi:molybdate transport system permease protein
VLRTYARTPLPWLAGILLLYLLVPLIAFLARIPGTPPGSLAAPGVGDALGISVLTATISTAVVTVLGIPLGYLLAHARGRIAAVFGVVVQLPLALPPLMSGILLIFLVGPYGPIGRWFNGALTDDTAGIVLAQVFVAAPFLIVSARSAFAAVDPALEDVAATLGHGLLSRAVRVALPTAAAGIRAGMLLAWLRAFGEFGATVVLAYHPYSLPVFTYVQFGSTGLDATTLPVAVTLVAALVVLLAAERWPLRLPRRRHTVLPAPLLPPPAASPRLEFDLTVRLGEFELHVQHQAQGRHLAILGASGAGKSATLRLLAGLLKPESGRFELDGHDVLGQLVERRGIGYLPQDSTLLPHLRVWDQIMFGAGADPGLAAFWLDRLRLTGLADRLPSQLSGGQGRRVAMARALVRQPSVLLADEPFTGLDTPVRDELRRVLRRLQRDTALTTVLVTHDPEEAALCSDEVVLLDHGRVIQSGDTRTVLTQPATPQAARLLGIRNIGTGQVTANGVLRAGGLRIPLPDTSPGPVTWCVRPEDVRLGDRSGHLATVLDVVHLGAVTEITVAPAGGGELTVLITEGPEPELGAPCRISLAPESVTVWPDGAGQEIMGQ